MKKTSQYLDFLISIMGIRSKKSLGVHYAELLTDDGSFNDSFATTFMDEIVKEEDEESAKMLS